MNRRKLSIFFCLLVIFGQQQVTHQSAPRIEYHLEDAIEDIAFFVPGAKVVLVTALKLWYVYGELQEKINPNATVIEQRLGKIEKKLQTMSKRLDQISENLGTLLNKVTDVKDLITEKVMKQLPMELNLNNKLVAIYDNLHEVDTLFKSFLKYYKAPKNKYEAKTLIDFAETVVGYGKNKLPSILEQIHNTLIEENSGINMLNILASKKLAVTMMCNRKQAAQIYINNLYNKIMKAEIKGFMMTELAYSIKKQFSKSNETYEAEIEDAKYDFYNRTIISLPEIKKAMSIALREVWTCDTDDEPEEGVTYGKLSPIFQTYIMNEMDAGVDKYKKKMTNSCKDSCSERKYATDLCRTDFCKDHGKQCDGFVRDCQSKSDYKLSICIANKDSSRRYEFVELIEKKGSVQLLGENRGCDEDNKVTAKKKKHWLLHNCEFCFCTCESITTSADRYFNLRPVTSDVDKNKIITGVRFEKKNNIFHINIQQGQLQSNGNVNKSSLIWKAVEDYSTTDKHIVVGRDYHKISWDERTVHLDSIDSPSGNVLTGLRFKLQDHALKLEIQTTPFVFSTGELQKGKSEWRSSSADDKTRTEIILNDHDIPKASYAHVANRKPNQFIKFTTSSLKKDIGQTVVPFIDFQEVKSTPAVPLSGVGLIHKGGEESAGYLSLKIFTYNYAPYLGK